MKKSISAYLLYLIFISVKSQECTKPWNLVKGRAVFCFKIVSSDKIDCDGTGSDSGAVQFETINKKYIAVAYLNELFKTTPKLKIKDVKPIIVQAEKDFTACYQMNSRNLKIISTCEKNTMTPVYYVCYKEVTTLNRICSNKYTLEPSAPIQFEIEWRCARKVNLVSSFSGSGIHSCSINSPDPMHIFTDDACICEQKSWTSSNGSFDCSTGKIFTPKISFGEESCIQNLSYEISSRSTGPACKIYVASTIDVCIYSEWSEFSCSTGCGAGTKSRKREVVKPYHLCGLPKEDIDSTQCLELSQCTCQIYYEAGSSWSSCSGPCNNVSMSRNVAKFHPGSDKWGNCKDLQVGKPEIRGCFNPCPENCVISDWTHWSKCTSGTCGTGYRYRRRAKIKKELFNGTCQQNIIFLENETCFTTFRECPIDCAYSNFSDWSRCPNCKQPYAPAIYKNRSRVIVQMPSTYGSHCDYSSLFESVVCENVKECGEMTEEEENMISVILPIVFGTIALIILVTCTVVVFNTRDKSHGAKRLHARQSHEKSKHADKKSKGKKPDHDHKSIQTSMLLSHEEKDGHAKPPKKKHTPKSPRKLSPKSSSKSSHYKASSTQKASNKPSRSKPSPKSSTRKLSHK